MYFLLDRLPRRGKRGKRQTGTQLPHAFRGSGAELSQADREALDLGDRVAARLNIERNMTNQPYGERRRRGCSPSPFSRRAQGKRPFRCADASD